MKAAATCVGSHKPSFSQNCISGSSVRVVIDVFSVKAAYAAITLKTSITTRTLEPEMQFWLSTGCSSLMMVYANRHMLQQLS
jgi:hypothetical protein